MSIMSKTINKIKGIYFDQVSSAQKILAYFFRGSITVQLTFCMTVLDSSKQVNLLSIQHKQSCVIQINKTGGQM